MKILSILTLILVFISSCATVPTAPPTLIPATPSSTKPPPAPGPTSAPETLPAPSDTPALTPATQAVELEPFGAISIEPSEIAFDVNGDGSNVDSIAFWEAPDPAESLMFVTSKGNESIEVYKYPFDTQLGAIACGDESNGAWVDQERDVLYITERDSSNVCAFTLPELEADSASSFTTGASGDDSEPNLAMLVLPGGERRIYVSYDDEVFYHNAGTGEALGSFTPREGLETMYGDNFYQLLYIPDENDRSGVYLYDPDGNTAGEPFGDRSIFDSDAEGIAVYRCFGSEDEDTGDGLVVVADQKDDLTDFEVFDRRTKAHLGAITISGVNNTDGIAITQQASPAYPLGLLAVIDDDESTVGIGWDVLLEKTGLSCSPGG